MKQFNLEEYLNNPRKGINMRKGLYVKPIMALITIPNGDEIIKAYWEDGVETRGAENNPYDLFFVTEKKTGWANVYKYASGGTHLGEIIYNSKEEAADLIANEKLNEREAKHYMEISLKREYASENGTDFNNILPKMNPLNPQYLTKKQTVFQKIVAFIDKFKGVGGHL